MAFKIRCTAFSISGKRKGSYKFSIEGLKNSCASEEVLIPLRYNNSATKRGSFNSIPNFSISESSSLPGGAGINQFLFIFLPLSFLFICILFWYETNRFTAYYNIFLRK